MENNVTKVSLKITDRVAAINPASGKIEKAQVVNVAMHSTGTVLLGLTFNKGETPVFFNRDDVFALYSVNPENVLDVTEMYLFRPKATL